MTNQKWKGFVITVIIFTAIELYIITASIIIGCFESIAPTIFAYFVGIAGLYGTLVTGRVVTDRDIAQNYKPELDTTRQIGNG